MGGESAYSGIDRESQAHRLCILGEAELVLLHIAVEQAAEQARQDRPLRNAILLPEELGADLDEVGSDVLAEQAEHLLAVGAEVHDLQDSTIGELGVNVHASRSGSPDLKVEHCAVHWRVERLVWRSCRVPLRACKGVRLRHLAPDVLLTVRTSAPFELLVDFGQRWRDLSVALDPIVVL